ncbi:potassium channel family protein [Fundidesulfovibrio butyratiphilus]
MPFGVIRKHRQFSITVVLFGMLILGGHLPHRIESLVFYLVVFGVALLSHVRGRFFAGILAGSTVCYLLAWTSDFHDVKYNILFCSAGLLCLGYGIHSIICFVLRSRRVTLGEVFALVNCYLLMGYFFALLYTLVSGFTPDAFVMGSHPERIMDSLIYFSFATMTTLGYGDIIPHAVLAQRLSVTQAIFGQFYFALVVAYLLNKLFQQRVDGLDKTGEE